jgi:Mn-containing catalase
VFFHAKGLQFEAKPDKPDAVYAMKLQELIGGAWGEMTVAMQYLFQGWNTRIPGKYKDLILDTGTEELAHVEMLSTMVARLLEGAPAEATARACDDNPVLAAIVGGQNPQHAIVGGGGALLADATGYPWNGKYIVASGNLMADFRANVAAEAQGRLQAARLYNMTDDHGVKQMLAFNLARDTMHQNQWLAAIEELKADGLEEEPTPGDFPQGKENEEFSYTLFNLSIGEESAEGRWASGPTPDGKGQFRYVADPQPLAPEPVLPPGDPELYATNPPGGGLVAKVKEKLG